MFFHKLYFKCTASYGGIQAWWILFFNFCRFYHSSYKATYLRISHSHPRDLSLLHSCDLAGHSIRNSANCAFCAVTWSRGLRSVAVYSPEPGPSARNLCPIDEREWNEIFQLKWRDQQQLEKYAEMRLPGGGTETIRGVVLEGMKMLVYTDHEVSLKSCSSYRLKGLPFNFIWCLQ